MVVVSCEDMAALFVEGYLDAAAVIVICKRVVGRHDFSAARGWVGECLGKEHTRKRRSLFEIFWVKIFFLKWTVY